jgi:Nucleotidyltransferase domain
MPRKPHFVLAARRWGWPLSPSYGRVRGLMTSVMGWKLKAETASCGFGSRQPGRARRGTPRTCGVDSCSCVRGQAGCVIVYSGKGQMMKVASTDDPILRRFKAALQEIYGDQIERIVLYGSRARGEAQPDSDYDAALFLSQVLLFVRRRSTR